MKKQFLTIFAYMLLVTVLFAQVPQGINYQSVVRNNTGAVIPNQNVSFRFTIASGSPTGTPVYSESHSVTTNTLGLVNMVIGQGGPLAPFTPSSFAAINWGSAAHYLVVELDPAGGTAFQPMGTSQLMSVPYALSSGNSTTSMAQLTDVTVTGVTDGQTLKWNAAQSKWLPANDIGGGTGDNWGTQTVQADNTLTGNGTSATPLKIAQQGATSGQVLKWNGSSWLPDNDIGGGTGDNWGTQTVQTNSTLTGNGTSGSPLAVNGVLTDNQTLSINGTTLSISSGNSVTLPSSSGGSGWELTGNSGTNPSANFIGTSDSVPLYIKVNNQVAGRIDVAAYPYLTSFGYKALSSVPVVAGDAGGCSAFGFYALKSNTTGTGNTGIGYQTLVENITGYSNTATGYHTLRNNIDGYSNSGYGTGSLRENTSGYRNVAVGVDAMHFNTTGFNNAALGFNALNVNTTGNGNTAVGGLSLRQNTTGEMNTAIGMYALSDNQTGSYNTAIGYYADVSNSNRTNTIAIAGNTNISITANNQVRIGNSSMTSIGGQVAWTNLSDERVKQNVSNDVKGLEFIMKLNPVTYNYSVSQSEQLQGKKETKDWTGKYDIEKIRFSGFMAQQVEAAAKEAGYSFSGVDKPEDAYGLWGLRYSEFTVPLVKAVQEQQAIIEQLMKEIEYLKSKID